MNTETQIRGFQTPFNFLSNFYYAPFVGPTQHMWGTVEHLYQFSKTDILSEQVWFLETVGTRYKPARAKKMGRMLTLRSDWDDIKLSVMEEAVRLKFENPTLSYMLIHTEGLEIIEDNNWGDTFWGVCNGVGENHLGKILMKVREEKLSALHSSILEDMKRAN